ncbi:hypothetical protein [Paenibacillus sp. NEAU-GSW1]|uniref:hypothetical protein n=1 Tax=Paenibacillus sp. NEAU-GSW1 TaxID=2682486 RepID=UPI001C12BD87|nr:hypothetical protein [Paenibacillus sp. NEAU-GSW1]
MTKIDFTTPGTAINASVDLANDSITISQDGVYKISISYEIAVDRNRIGESILYINNSPEFITQTDTSVVSADTGFSTFFVSISGTYILNLSANDVLDVRMSSLFVGQEVDVSNAAFTVRRIG